MPSFSRNDVVLVAYPFSDRTGSKVRPAVIVSGSHRSRDLFVVPLTSRADRMAEGEFSLTDWRSAGLNRRAVTTVIVPPPGHEEPRPDTAFLMASPSR
jgi:mRNA-degrading endonuclease toxin of MazEF toxin-antitoxin module